MDRQYIRQSHSRMEEERSSSYYLMATDASFNKSYEVYVDIISSILKSESVNFKILNIGFGAGNLENLILKRIHGKYALYSLDNSVSNLRFAEHLNKDFLDSGKLHLMLLDILKDDIESGPFDIILSRDLNHHLTDIPFYLNRCSSLLKKNGFMLMEDLRYDGDPDSIIHFARSIFNVKKLKTDRWLLYQKLLGFLESMASAYTFEEIEHLVENTFLGKKFILSSLRYHYLLSNNPSVIKEYGFILDKINNTQND